MENMHFEVGINMSIFGKESKRVVGHKKKKNSTVKRKAYFRPKKGAARAKADRHLKKKDSKV